jgi:hypothetical protein
MLPGQIAEEAPEIGAPALLVCGECAFRFGGQVAGSGIQAEGDAAGQKRGSKYELAAGCGFLPGNSHGIAFYTVIQGLRPAKVHENPPQQLRRIFNSLGRVLDPVLGEALRAGRISG